MIAPNNSLGAYVERYLLARDLSTDYAATVRLRIMAFEAWAGSPVPIGSLSHDLVNEWLVSIQASGYEAWTVKGYRAAILAVWNAAGDEQLCKHPNTRLVRKIAIRQTIVEGWTVSEVQRILDYCAGLPGKMQSGVAVASYWSAATRVGYCSGARLGDVLRLTREQIDTNGRWIFIQRKTGKPQLVRLHDSTLAAIEKLFPPERKLVFEWPFCNGHWSKCFAQIVRAAGLRGSYKWLRRSSGSLVEAQQPGAGHKHLGNGSAVFDRHYSVPRLAESNRPMPPELDS